MSRISSTGITTSAGLISGIPIEDTVDQLVAVAARPRNQLANRNQGLVAERTAVDTLRTLALGVKASLGRFRASNTFSSRTATSSNNDSLRVGVQGGATPTPGSYLVTPLRPATPHQLVSARIDDVNSLGTGSLSFGFGGHVDQGVGIDELSSTFVGGQIRITDADGQNAIIDLRGSQSIDDVLDAINESIDIDVTASTDGDRLVLTDNSGGTGSLRVREVSGGATAESLGIVGNAVGTTLTGEDIYGLTADSRLTSLNDGLGIRFDAEADNDLRITLADGTAAEIDLSEAETLGDVIDAINGVESFSGKLTASINANDNGLTLTDSTTGDSLVVEDLGAGSVATDLRIAASADDNVTGTLDGGRLITGLRDTLVSTLNAGAGFDLGEISLTDRSGAADTVDLDGAETLNEIIDRINAASTDVVASINAARNGLVLTDGSGGAGSLVVADINGGTSAQDFGLTINEATDSVDSGSLARQTVGEATLLEDFNGGQGVEVSSFRIKNSSGRAVTVRLEETEDGAGDAARTIGDVIDQINGKGIGVQARINDTGDGILLTDTTGGSGKLSVEEVSGGTAAADLGLLGSSSDTNDANQPILDGSTRKTIDLSGLSNSPEAVSLSRLNGGDGIELGVFRINPGDGRVGFNVDLGVGEEDAETIGDVIERINSAVGNNGAVTASLNEAQDGIVLTDNTDGDGAFTVTDLGTGSTAADLKLVKPPEDSITKEIGSGRLFTVSSDDALQTLAERINDANAGVTASVFDDGNGFRLSLVTDKSGSNNELLVDGEGVFGFTETSRPSDAVALIGGVAGIGGFAATSQDNQFNDVIEGLNLTVNSATGETVTIDVAENAQPVIDAAQSFVTAYNALRDNLDSVTDFDADSQSTGILFGRSEVVRVDSELSRLLSDRYRAGGDFDSLRDVGISFSVGADGTANGKIELDESRLTEALAEDPAAVEQLFRAEDIGVVARLDEVIDGLAGDDNSLLLSRSDNLTDTIEGNENRITELDDRLDRQRELLLLDFIKLEQTLSLLQSNTTFLDSIQSISIQNSSS